MSRVHPRRTSLGTFDGERGKGAGYVETPVELALATPAPGSADRGNVGAAAGANAGAAAGANAGTPDGANAGAYDASNADAAGGRAHELSLATAPGGGRTERIAARLGTREVEQVLAPARRPVGLAAAGTYHDGGTYSDREVAVRRRGPHAVPDGGEAYELRFAVEPPAGRERSLLARVPAPALSRVREEVRERVDGGR